MAFSVLKLGNTELKLEPPHTYINIQWATLSGIIRNKELRENTGTAMFYLVEQKVFAIWWLKLGRLRWTFQKLSAEVTPSTGFNREIVVFPSSRSNSWRAYNSESPNRWATDSLRLSLHTPHRPRQHFNFVNTSSKKSFGFMDTYAYEHARPNRTFGSQIVGPFGRPTSSTVWAVTYLLTRSGDICNSLLFFVVKLTAESCNRVVFFYNEPQHQ